MYTTRDVYGNPRFIIHFLDLVHEDHPGDHVDKMESATAHGEQAWRETVPRPGIRRGLRFSSIRAGFIDR